MNDLKPCPFCGRIPVIEDCGKNSYFVRCKCGIAQDKLYWQRCDAVRRWNTRRQQPDLDEWCTDCKEYDSEKHCCPRFNRVIRSALKDARPETRKGKWIITHDGGLNTAVCSECKYMIGHIVGCEYFRYCPKCGARLEVENE